MSHATPTRVSTLVMVLRVGLLLLGLGAGFDRFSVYAGHGEKETGASMSCWRVGRHCS
jgi:hypothetical protein